MIFKFTITWEPKIQLTHCHSLLWMSRTREDKLSGIAKYQAGFNVLYQKTIIPCLTIIVKRSYNRKYMMKTTTFTGVLYNNFKYFDE